MDLSDVSLPELLDSVRAGHEGAAEEVVRRFQERVRGALHGRLRPELRRRLDTDDVLQSTMALALRDLDGFEFRGEAQFVSWLLTVAERRLHAAARYHGAARRDVRREDSPKESAPPDPDPTSPSEHAARAESRERVQALIDTLSPKARQIVQMHVVEGVTFQEIADRLGLPSAGAARQRYLRAVSGARASAPRTEDTR